MNDVSNLNLNSIMSFQYLLGVQASQGDNKANVIKDILSKLPIGGGGNKMNQGEEIQAQSKAYNFDPNNIAPREVQQQLLALLKWRDGLYRDVVKTIERIPGLEDLVDQLSNALNACKVSMSIQSPR
jgi:Heterokaryon incompatibility protein Het-C